MARSGLYDWEASARRRFENLEVNPAFRESLEETSARVRGGSDDPAEVSVYVGEFITNWKLPASAFEVYAHYFQSGEWDWTRVVPPVTVVAMNGSSYPRGFNSRDAYVIDFGNQQLAPDGDPKDYVALYISPDATLTGLRQFLTKEFKNTIEPRLQALHHAQAKSPRKRPLRSRDAAVYKLWLEHKDVHKVALLWADTDFDGSLTKKEISVIIAKQLKGKDRVEFLGTARLTEN